MKRDAWPYIILLQNTCKTYYFKRDQRGAAEYQCVCVCVCARVCACAPVRACVRACYSKSLDKSKFINS